MRWLGDGLEKVEGSPEYLTEANEQRLDWTRWTESSGKGLNKIFSELCPLQPLWYLIIVFFGLFTVLWPYCTTGQSGALFPSSWQAGMVWAKPHSDGSAKPTHLLFGPVWWCTPTVMPKFLVCKWILAVGFPMQITWLFFFLISKLMFGSTPF